MLLPCGCGQQPNVRTSPILLCLTLRPTWRQMFYSHSQFFWPIPTVQQFPIMCILRTGWSTLYRIPYTDWPVGGIIRGSFPGWGISDRLWIPLTLYPVVTGAVSRSRAARSLTLTIPSSDEVEVTWSYAYFLRITHKIPITVAARSKAWVCGRTPAEIMGSNPTGGMDVCCECCVLSGRGLCDELITRPEESYRLWCVVVCDLETSRMRRPWPALGRSATGRRRRRRRRNLIANA